MRKGLLLAMTFLLLSGTLLATDHVVIPFIQKATAPIDVNGDLTEWNFCFPVDMNAGSVPSGSVSQAWLPDDNNDLAGTIKLMWDDDYLYFSAQIRDDAPAVEGDGGRNRDGFELYLGNYDVGDVLHGEEHGADFYDEISGLYEVMIGCYYNAAADTGEIWQYQTENRSLLSDDTQIAGVVWLGGNGYTLEGRILWTDMQSSNYNLFEPMADMRVPAAFMLVDVDAAGQESFEGYTFSLLDPVVNPGGPAWQVMEFKGERANDYYELSSPYMKKAKAPITVDGELDEWNFCFPVDLNDGTVPPNGRARGWQQTGDNDVSGTLMFMYDDENIYFAGKVRDDVPGMHSEDPKNIVNWSYDQIELYIGNYDIGPDAIHGENHGDEYLDSDTGEMEAQYVMTTGDSGHFVFYKRPVPGAQLNGEGTLSACTGTIWPQGDGYNIEGQINIAEAMSPNFNFMALEAGNRYPATYSIFDRDHAIIDDFGGWQYSVAAPWALPGGASWQFVDAKDVCLFDLLDESPVDDAVLPGVAGFALHANYPNPFNPSTTLSYDLTRPGVVNLSVVNVRGETVRRVICDAFQAAGFHSVRVDFSDLSSGMYFTILEQGGKIASHKMMLLK